MSETIAPLGGNLPHVSDVRTVARRESFYERRLKRAFDLVVAVAALLVMLPVTVLIASAIRIGLGPGVMYRQERVGRDGAPFTIWKFRTMRPDRRKQRSVSVDGDRRLAHKATHDPRHTGLGRALRRLSLDELPQLWNVVSGDMSIVGPRPEVWEIAEQRGYLHHVRHRVRPGITGPYQTSELRRNGDLRDGLDLDAQYVANVTFRGDLRYLFGTIVALALRGPSGS